MSDQTESNAIRWKQYKELGVTEQDVADAKRLGVEVNPRIGHGQ